MKNILFASFVSLFGCSTAQHPPLKTVPQVDMAKYMGDWYVIANIPTFIEKGAHNAKENYSWNEKEKHIDVHFTFNADKPDGDKKSYNQKAFIFDKKTNAEWRIQFVWPFKFPYLIIDLAPDYSYTVVGVPNRDYLWIMARTPKMNEDTYQQIIHRLKEQYYDIDKIQRVPQSGKL